jgi:hypothetical protein
MLLNYLPGFAGLLFVNKIQAENGRLWAMGCEQ